MGGVKPRVSFLPGGMFAKTKPIQHGFGDNTEVIQNEAQAIHARYQNIQGPKNMPYGTGASATRGASDEGKAFNGGTVTAPPQEFSG